MMTTGLTERLELIKNIALGAMNGKSDEELAKEFGKNVWSIAEIRKAAGVKRTWRLDITKEYKKSSVVDGGYSHVGFSLDKTQLSELGIEEGGKSEFTGKITNGKLVLTFKNI